MGIDALDAEFILREHRFRPLPRTVHLLGRQTVRLNYAQADALMRRHGIVPASVPITIDRSTSHAIATGGEFITDATFFGMLGVKVVRAIDHSDFEGADIILDLNHPIPDALAGTVEFLYGGSVLDNVFDPATYLENVVRLLAPGGRVIDVNALSFHLHPYVLLSPIWYFDYFVLNAFNDCKVYVLQSAGEKAHAYRLEVHPDDAFAADFGEGGVGVGLSTVVVAEKGKEAGAPRKPSQDQYRDPAEWAAYRSGLERIKASPRPVWTFARPTAVELLRMPLRWSKSLRYVGMLGGSDESPFDGTLPAPGESGIRIVEASYGLNVFGMPLPRPAIVPLCRGNATDQIGALLNGRSEVRLVIDVEMLGDPAPGLGKDLTILYYYADAAAKVVHQAYLPAEAHGRLLEIPPYRDETPVNAHLPANAQAKLSESRPLPGLKLFTAICNDARLAEPFLEHYSKGGVTEFCIATSSEYVERLTQLGGRYPITLFLNLDVHESIYGGSSAVSRMRELHQGDSEWVIIVDLDEFIERLEDVPDLIAAADKAGSNVIRGIMHDRFAADGRLCDFEAGADLSKVYPVKSRFIRDVMQGCDYKGVLVRGKLEGVPGGGHHGFVGESVFAETLEISHYKWNSTAIARLKAAHRHLVATGVPWAIEYQRAIQCYEQNGRFDWERFGGELVGNAIDIESQSAEPDGPTPSRVCTAIKDNEVDLAPPRPSDEMMNQFLSRKYALEAEMQARPTDEDLRGRYLSLLKEISFSSFGSFFAVLPEIAAPILFRGGTSDIWSMEQIFFKREYDLPVTTPRRILDLGAYAGYTAIFFANRYPVAEIISVEPGGANFDTLTTNAKPYPNISCLSAAVSAKRAELALSDVIYGDWGTCYEDGADAPPLAPAGGPGTPVAGYTISDILEISGWDGVDLIKCSSHSGRVDVLLRPRPDWLATMVTLITRPGAAGWRDEDAEKLQEVLPEAEFKRTDHGPVTVFNRRAAARAEELPPAGRVIPEPPYRRAFALSNVDVADKITFFKFGHSNIQLMPSPPGSPARSFATQIPLDGHSCFRVRLATGDGSPGRGGIGEALPGDQSLIRFRVQLVDDQDRRCVLDAERVLAVNAVFDWELQFTPSRGLFTVILSTEHASSDAAVDPGRTSYFIEPRFHCQPDGRSAGEELGGEADEVTVVLTSCGRQDLLERTLDSFLAHNNFPVRQFIVVEDGDGSRNGRLAEKYREYPFVWLATADRVGQVAAIDIAYSHVNTEWIFHCEDDWEFTAPGFIEKSLAILKKDPHVLQVYLRALNDTNGHPTLDDVHVVADVPYRLMCHNFDTESWGLWHGFAWNPGLRRRSDYQALGSFGSLDPSGSRLPWEVEWAAGEFYRERDFFAAILIDNGGLGYVRHLGDGRHVPDRRPVDLPFSAEVAGGEAISGRDLPIVEPAAPNEPGAIPSEQPVVEGTLDGAPDAERTPSAARDRRVRLLTEHLSTLPRFCSVPHFCTRGVPGVDEIPEWQIWTHQPTTDDQLSIEEALETMVTASSSILHVGVGNSGLAKRFAPRVRSVWGITLHEEELALADSLNTPNYVVKVLNKYDDIVEQIPEQFDFIVDNNPSSFSCCLFHFCRMSATYWDLLKDRGKILTAQGGLGWVVPDNDKNWSLQWEDWVELGRVLGMPATKVNEFVYAMECDRGSGATDSDAVGEPGLDAGPAAGEIGSVTRSSAIQAALPVTPAAVVRLPILAYHSIADDGPPELRHWRVTPAAFEAQLRFLQQQGYRSISLDQCADCIAAGSPPAGRSVVITFDDGYADFLTQAAPRLEAAGFRATVFVVTGRVGSTADWDTTAGPPLVLMSWADLRALEARGFSIGSHMNAHRDLTALSDEEIERDGREARAALRRELGHDVTSVAFPGGTNDARVRAALARAGYRVGVEVADNGSTLSSDIGCLPRIEILADDDAAAFARKLELAADASFLES